MEAKTIRSVAWLLKGLAGSTTGVLELMQGRLAFYTPEGCVWNVALGEIRHLQFPWYYFGGGMKLQIGQERYRISFVRPNSGEHVVDRMLMERLGGMVGGASAVLTLGQTAHDIGTGRRAGQVWKTALTSASTS